MCGRQNNAPPKRLCPNRYSLWIHSISKAIQMELRWLICWPWDGECILNYPSGPKVIKRFLIIGTGRQKCQSQRDLNVLHGWVSGWKKWPKAKEYQLLLQVGKDKEMEFLKPPEGIQPCWHFDFSPLRPILDFCL